VTEDANDARYGYSSKTSTNDATYLATILAPSIDCVARTTLTASSAFCRWSRLILFTTRHTRLDYCGTGVRTVVHYSEDPLFQRSAILTV